MKYFKLIRNDGAYWITPNITKLLDNLGMLTIDRKLRSTYEGTSLKVAYGGFYYSLQRFYTEGGETIEFGAYDKNGNRQSPDVEVVLNQMDDTIEELEELSKPQLIDIVFKLKRSLQKYMDNLRVERATLRRANRDIATYSDVLEELPYLINKVDYKVNTKADKVNNKEMILQLSDLHFGEVVDLAVNKYNFEVAKERLIKLFTTTLNKAKLENISNITILFTGDLINLDSHMDKKLTNEGTRTTALVKGFEILSGCIDLLIKNNISVSLGGIVGNEGRVNAIENMTYEDNLANNNFDTLMFNMLKTRFGESVSYINDCDTLECMVKVNGKNIIITHGNNITHSRLDSEITNVKMRHYQESNIMADYVLFGHIHSHLIAPSYARSGSLVGTNSYSYNGLNIAGGKASQNLILIGDTIEVTPVILSE